MQKNPASIRIGAEKGISYSTHELQIDKFFLEENVFQMPLKCIRPVPSNYTSKRKNWTNVQRFLQGYVLQYHLKRKSE